MKKVTEQTKYEVCSFVDKNGKSTDKEEEMTIMCATALHGVMSGVSIPMTMDLAKKLRLKIGDKFLETTTYQRLWKE